MKATTLNVTALCRHKETWKDIQGALSRVQGVHVHPRRRDEETGSLAELRPQTLGDVLIVEIDTNDRTEIEGIERLLREHEGEFTVFVTYREGTMETMRQLMHAGVKYVFPQPINAQELVLDVTEALVAKRDRAENLQGLANGVVAFMNAKGGSGATTLAVNIAHTLVEKHKLKVGLLDLDLQFGVVAMHLDLIPRTDISNALLEPGRIDPVFLKALMTPHDSGLEILASPADLSPIENIDENAIRRLLHAAVENYDLVILDVPRIITPWVVSCLTLADLMMLVVQNSLSTIRDAKAILDHFPGLGLPLSDIELINNRAMAKANSVPIDRLKETLGKDRIHRIRNDFEAASRAQDYGIPIRSLPSRSPLAQDVENLADYLFELHSGKERNTKQGGFLSRFFKPH